MHVGFDAKRLFFNNTGLGNYSRTLVDNLIEYYPDSKYSLFSPYGKNDIIEKYKSTSQTEVELIDGPLKSIRRTLGFNHLIKNAGVDLFHGLSNELPYSIKNLSIPKIVTIHDLIYMTYPKDFTFIDRNIYHAKTKYACQIADVIVAISESTKRDIIKHLDIPEHKIQVLYQSCQSIFQNQNKPKKNYTGLPSEFLLYVGTISSRKNLMGIIEALHIIPKDQLVPLVVVGGGSDNLVAEIRKKIEKYRLTNYISFIGRVPNEDLKSIYHQAMCTILPSHYEGFGIPIIESLFSNTPVITSNVTSLPEAAGNCGLLVDPSNVTQIAKAIQDITQNEDLRRTLISRIPHHISKFNSLNTTVDMMKTYQSLD